MKIMRVYIHSKDSYTISLSCVVTGTGPIHASCVPQDNFRLITSNHGRGMNPTHGSGRVSFLGPSRSKRSSLKARFFPEIRAGGANRQCDAMRKLLCVGGVVREGWGCAFVSQKRYQRKKAGGV